MCSLLNAEPFKTSFAHSLKERAYTTLFIFISNWKSCFHLNYVRIQANMRKTSLRCLNQYNLFGIKSNVIDHMVQECGIAPPHIHIFQNCQRILIDLHKSHKFPKFHTLPYMCKCCSYYYFEFIIIKPLQIRPSTVLSEFLNKLSVSYNLLMFHVLYYYGYLPLNRLWIINLSPKSFS